MQTHFASTTTTRATQDELSLAAAPRPLKCRQYANGLLGVWLKGYAIRRAFEFWLGSARFCLSWLTNTDDRRILSRLAESLAVHEASVLKGSEANAAKSYGKPPGVACCCSFLLSKTFYERGFWLKVYAYAYSEYG